MRLSTDAKLGILLVIFCIIMFVATFAIEQRPYISLGADVFPRVILAALTPLCVALLIKGLRQGPPQGPRVTLHMVRETMWRFRTVLSSFVLFLLLTVAMPIIGFLASGVLYLAAMLFVLGPKGWRELPFILVISLGFGGGVYAIFRYVLYVLVPEGIFFE